MTTMTAMNNSRTGRRYDREFKSNAVARVTPHVHRAGAAARDIQAA